MNTYSSVGVSTDMVEIAREKIEVGEERPYDQSSDWREKKTKRALFKEYIRNHKLLTAAMICLGACITLNVILIYSFFRILATL